MPTARISQTAVEVLTKDYSKARVSQTVVEVLTRDFSKARISQVAVEVLQNLDQVRTTQVVAEVLTGGVDPDGRVTQVAAEVLTGGTVPTGRVTQIALEVLTTPTTTTTTSTTTTSTTTTTIHGSVCYGHDTGVTEDHTEDFTGKWGGSATTLGSGDSEQLRFYNNQYKQLVNPWWYGTGQATIQLNKYQTGDNVSIYYKTAGNLSAIEALGWTPYSGKFTSQGYVDVRLVRGAYVSTTSTTSTSTTSTTGTTTTTTVTTTTVSYGSDFTFPSDMTYEVSCSSRYSNYYAAQAIDGSSSTKCVINGSSGWLEIKCPTGRVPRKLTLTSGTNYLTEYPKDFTLEASNTGSFSGEEDTLLTVTGSTGWSASETREWEFENTTAYTYFRLDVTANDGGGNLSIQDLELIPASYEVLSGWPPYDDYGAEMAQGEDSDASSQYSAGNASEYAVDGNTGTMWVSSSGPPQWWEVNFVVGRKINKVSITSRSDIYYYEGPGTFTIEGSNTGDFSGEEDTLLSVVGLVAWTQSETRSFEFFNANYYKHYRMNCTGNASGNVSMAEIKMYGAQGDNASTTTTTTTSTTTTTTLPYFDYETDFSEYTIGVTPGDWSEHWHTGDFSLDIASGDIGGKQLYFDKSVLSSRCACSWDDIGSKLNVEILCKLQWTSTGSYLIGPACRLAGGSTNETGYALWLDDNSNAILLRRYNAGTGSSDLASHSHTMTTDTYYWVRARFVGSGIKARIWDDGSSEHGTWDIDYTDPSPLTSSGAVGLANYSYDGWCDYFGVKLLTTTTTTTTTTTV